MPRSVLLNLTGLDQPGVTATLFSALPAEVEVLDVEQVVVDGLLTLSVLIRSSSELDEHLAHELAENALSPFGIAVSSAGTHRQESVPAPAERQTITVLGKPLSSAMLAELSKSVAAAGANIDRIERIADYPVTALELKVSGSGLDRVRTSLAKLSATSGLDIAVQRGGLDRRGRHLVVMDVDSTVIQDEVVELLAARAGVAEQVTAITAAAMRGELDFASSLRERVALLAGLPESVLTDVFQQLRLTPGARTLCRVLKSMDYQIALVSGGFTQVVAPLARELGVDYFAANELEIQDGKLTGRIVGRIVDRAGKAAWLREFAQQSGIDLNRTIAVGDGANDLDMLATANLGIAFNAKPVVQASADAAVNVPYLDTVLYLLGITRAEVEQLQNSDK